MRKNERFHVIIAIVTVAATIASVVATAIVYFEKKKKEVKELEDYLDGSIM